MLSIKQAATRGIERLRLSHWAIPEDHIKIDIINGAPGPWIHLYSPFNKECNGKDPMPIPFFSIDYEKEEYEPYTGALPDSDEYKAKVALYEGANKTK